MMCYLPAELPYAGVLHHFFLFVINRVSINFLKIQDDRRMILSHFHTEDPHFLSNLEMSLVMLHPVLAPCILRDIFLCKEKMH